MTMTNRTDGVSRRKFILATGAVSVAGLAGCSETEEQDAAIQQVEASDPETDESVVDPDGWATKYSERQQVYLTDELDSSGDPAWDQSEHPHVYVTSNGPGYSGQLSSVELPGISIVDADTHEEVVSKQFDLGIDEPFEPHGCAVSPDGKWIYSLTGGGGFSTGTGRLMIVNAETLKIDKILTTAGMPHHVKTFELYDGRPVVLAYTFNWYNAEPMRESTTGMIVMDPADDHRVIGGIDGEMLQEHPYLAFPHPDGRHLLISCPDGKHEHVDGLWAVVEMENWTAVDFFPGGLGPIYGAFTVDGRHAYLGASYEDTVFKYDAAANEVVDESNSGTFGLYGVTLSPDENSLYTVGKGEGSHNVGKTLGKVDTTSMNAVDEFDYGVTRGDHALVNPFQPSELWISGNASFNDVVWDMETDQRVENIEKSGSSHNGAFVDYETDDEWKVVFDQAGWHGWARDEQMDRVGADEVVEWGSEDV